MSSVAAAAPSFWFVMSMGLLIGFIIAYPMNWWLVANKLKHGMMTVRPASAHAHAGAAHEHMSHMSMAMDEAQPLRPSLSVMTLLSFLALAAGLAIGRLFWPDRLRKLLRRQQAVARRQELGDVVPVDI